MDFSLALCVGGAFFVAGAVKGIAGLGLPTVAVGLLSLVMPTSAAAALLILPSVVTNAVQSFGGRIARVVPVLWPMWLAIPLGVLVSPVPGLADNGPFVRAGLGAVLVAYGAYGLLKPQLTLRCAKPLMLFLSASTGYATGVLTAATGVFILPMLIFLQALDLDREEMVQALGISFLVCTAALFVAVGPRQSFAAGFSSTGALALASSLAGLYFGSTLRGRLNLAIFRRVLFGLFIVLGAAMLVKGMSQ